MRQPSRPLYPYRLYVYGSHGFNNYFLFLHYMNQYKNDKTFLYSPKNSWTDVMTRLYATLNNLCHLSCNIEKGMAKYQNPSIVNFKIADTTDMLIAFWDGRDKSILPLKNAFDVSHKPVSLIDVNGSDAIIPGIVAEQDESSKPAVKFSELYGKYVDTNYHAETHTEAAMKFLSDAYRNKELMKLIIDNKNTALLTENRLELSIKALLYWIYENQFCILEEDYNTLAYEENPDRKKRFTLQEYKHAEPCDWKLEGESTNLYTGTGLLLAKGYKTVVEFRDKQFVEINDLDIIKEHIHKSMKSYLFTENEEDCTKVTYRTSDTESYPISYQVANFETSVFKMGYWYISTDFVTTKEPIKQREKVCLDGN